MRIHRGMEDLGGGGSALHTAEYHSLQSLPFSHCPLRTVVLFQSVIVPGKEKTAQGGRAGREFWSKTVRQGENHMPGEQ